MASDRHRRAARRCGLLALLLPLLLVPYVVPAPLAAESDGWFTDVSLEVGLDFVHDAAIEGDYFMPESLGSGGAFLDYDGDGDLDIYLLQGTHRDPEKRAAKPLVNRLFRQDEGRFVDVTEASGLGDPGYANGVAVGDYDNDGDLDVYLANFGPDALYRNEGDGTFRHVSEETGARNDEWGASALFFDYDLDGHLDVYVANYVRWIPSIECYDRAGRTDYCGPWGFEGLPDALLHNEGDGTFTDASASSGVAAGPSKGLGVTSADFDGDGRPDVLVANDAVANQLWLNLGDGRFREEALGLGLAVDGLGRPGAGMGIALGDVDADGDTDYYVTQFFDDNNVLYRNLGAHGYSDDTALARLAGPDFPLTCFGTGFFDYDNDGDLDLAAVGGRVIRGVRRVQREPPDYWDDYADPNLLFENDGTGKFRDVSAQAGDFAATIENSRGLVFGDYDNDGDVDLLVTNEGGRARLLRNDFPNRGHWLMVRAVDPALKRDAVGAEVRVHAGDRVLSRLVAPAYSYASSSDPRVHFGLGSATEVDRIEVIWPGGERESFPGGAADRHLLLERGTGQAARP
jgi:hypothetical protein